MPAPSTPPTTDQTTPTTDKELDAACAAVTGEIIGVRAGSRGPPGGRGSASQLVDRPAWVVHSLV
jgi:hypothetical protein